MCECSANFYWVFSCLYFREITFGEKMCLDTLEHKSGNVGLWECHGEGRNQVFYLKDHKIGVPLAI